MVLSGYKRVCPLYINPEVDTDTFQVEFFAIDNVNNLPLNQEITVFASTLLKFEKDNDTYTLVDKK